MINLAEHYRFEILENDGEHAAFRRAMLEHAPEGFWVNLQNQNTAIVLSSFSVLKKYDYFFHPKFGVVVSLNSDGTEIMRTPLCEQIEVAARKVFLNADS